MKRTPGASAAPSLRAGERRFGLRTVDPATHGPTPRGRGWAVRRHRLAVGKRSSAAGWCATSFNVLNLLLGVATHSCELAAFASYWVVPGSLVMTDARIEREVGAMRPTDFPSPLECPVPLPEPPARSLYLNVS